MNIGHIHPRSDIYGPGTRFVVWTQGCSIRCSGCWNEQFWDFRQGQSLTVPKLLAMIHSHEGEIEGITILGGEPFDQPKDLAQLCAAVQEIGLSVLVYSGYSLEELVEKGYAAILAHCDLLIDGRYEEQQRNVGAQWRGSNNQRIFFLSDRYQKSMLKEAQEIEILIDEDGSELTYGYPESWLSTSKIQ